MIMTKERARSLIVTVVLLLLLAIFVLNTGCSSHHYFSINAEEITNPQIEYHDSLNVTKPW